MFRKLGPVPPCCADVYCVIKYTEHRGGATQVSDWVTMFPPRHWVYEDFEAPALGCVFSKKTNVAPSLGRVLSMISKTGP